MNAVKIKSLSKHFGDNKAVDNISLTINQGEVFGIVGPDGAGKTTTMRMMCTITTPTDGSIEIFDMDIAKKRSQIKKNIGYLSQKFSLYQDLSIEENMEFLADIHDVKHFKQRRDQLLEVTHLTPFRKRLAGKLSGGMKQKLALACTLIHTPKIIFLDEPTTGVDPVSRRDFWKILSELPSQGITIVMTTPYLDEAERCNRIALMDKGSFIVVDTPKKIKSSLSSKVIEILCDNIRTVFKEIRQIPQLLELQVFGDRINIIVENIDEAMALIKQRLQAKNLDITSWREIQPSLENVFISLIKNKMD